jgi:hypothetical protein
MFFQCTLQKQILATLFERVSIYVHWGIVCGEAKSFVLKASKIYFFFENIALSKAFVVKQGVYLVTVFVSKVTEFFFHTLCLQAASLWKDSNGCWQRCHQR